MPRYREIQPSARLQPFVESFWMLEHDGESNAVQRVVPDGRTELILNFDQPFESWATGEWRRQPRCFIATTAYDGDRVSFVALPEGMQPLLPETQSVLLRQVALRKRSSLVEMLPPGCCALGGALVAPMATLVWVTVTLLAAGVP